jgi:predicted dehydrogenase
MDKLRWGLIGCGDIAKKRVAPALRDLENCDFVAVSRERFDLAGPFAAEFGARKWHKTWQELIEDEHIDAVYVATPVYLHCRQTTAAAKAGKHVLCEKPMAMSVGQCDRMIKACNKEGVKLGVAYYRHFYPVINRIKEILAGGEIGRVVFVQVNAFEYSNPPADSRRHWFVEKDKAGGGPMFDFGCHRIEVLLNILGPVKSVKGFTDNILFERQVEDTSVAVFKFECGAMGVLNVTHCSKEPQDTLDIFADNGSIHVPVLNNGDIIINTPSGRRKEEHPPHSNIHQPLIDDFTLAVLEGKEPSVGGDIGREVNRIEEKIYSR